MTRAKVRINWTECAAIEIVPGRVSGAPVIKDSRVRPEDLIVNRAEGEACAGHKTSAPRVPFQSATHNFPPAIVPRALRHLLPRHDVQTADEMGWPTLANGLLVDAAERAGLEAIITADRGFRFHVNISARNLAVIILSTNDWPTLQRGAPSILRVL